MGTGADAGLARPLGHGPGWEKLAEAVRAEVPPAEIETLYLFKPLKRDGRNQLQEKTKNKRRRSF